MSVKSYASSRMSIASRGSQKPKKEDETRLPEIAPDSKSLRSDTDSVWSRPMSSYSNLNEEDEWTAI